MTMAGSQARLQIVIDALNNASAEIKTLEKDLGGVEASSEKTSNAQKSMFGTMKNGYLDIKVVAMDAFGGLQKVWDFAESGAQLELQRGRFDRLATSIGTTADVLKGQLATATKGMLSDSEQIQMGTDLMSLGLAKTSDQVVRLSRASAGLGMDMNELVLTLANQTTMRFDQLGVSIDGFDARLAKLKDSGMDANAAFTEAFLQQAEAQMAKLGDASDTTAGKMKRVEATLKNVTDGLKEFAASGIEAGITLVEAPTKIADAFTGTANKMKDDVAAGKMSVEDYNNALTGMADNMRGVLSPAIVDTLLNMQRLTQEQATAIQVTRDFNAALNEKAQADTTAAQEALNSRNETTREYVAQLGAQMKAAQDAAAQEQASIAAEALHRSSIAESITANANLAQSLKSATDAQATQMLAQSQLDTLKKAYEEGKISQEGFNKATDQVLLRYDLATPKSIAMADAQREINKAFLEGDLPLKDFITSTEKIPKIAEDGKVTLQELAESGVKPTTEAVFEQTSKVDDLTGAWGKVPTTVKTVYTIETKGEEPSGATSKSNGNLPSRARGGPTGQGGLFLLHPNEFVLSEAMRRGRAPIPAEAVPVSGITGRQFIDSRTQNIYLQDTLATKMWLEQQRLERIRSTAEAM
jgi:hypothetical protein